MLITALTEKIQQQTFEFPLNSVKHCDHFLYHVPHSLTYTCQYKENGWGERYKQWVVITALENVNFFINDIDRKK